ncbi:type III-D CRISPR-associated protein Csx19 [Sharpea azabuensis]|uniref:type III-D CRISPR-associated protein Csx19 n=1 Tax=Sharpea azabuensis TaxID=322505 RepID=UPI0013D90633|nr:CRISPR-associated protein Csx19 [Sharpea azabuensis]
MREDILEILKKRQVTNQSIVLAYFTDQVLVGLYQDHDIIFANDRIINDDLLTRIHVFNKDKEVRIILVGDQILENEISIRNDGDSITERMYLPSEKSTPIYVDDNFNRITQYGRKIDIPVAKIPATANFMNICLIVRNHFTSNKDHFSLDQYQLVDLEEWEGRH